MFLATFVCLQLLLFLIIASITLWIDQLVNAAIAHMSSHTPIYLGLFITTMVVSIFIVEVSSYILNV